LKCYKVVVFLGRLQSLESIGVGKKGFSEKKSPDTEKEDLGKSEYDAATAMELLPCCCCHGAIAKPLLLLSCYCCHAAAAMELLEKDNHRSTHSCSSCRCSPQQLRLQNWGDDDDVVHHQN
jgi:hypothetical protein